MKIQKTIGLIILIFSLYGLVDSYMHFNVALKAAPAFIEQQINSRAELQKNSNLPIPDLDTQALGKTYYSGIYSSFYLSIAIDILIGVPGLGLLLSKKVIKRGLLWPMLGSIVLVLALVKAFAPSDGGIPLVVPIAALFLIVYEILFIVSMTRSEKATA